MIDQEKARAASAKSEFELMKLYIDIYKHHFDLWLKGYVFYLAIVGSAAGFIFGKNTSLDTSRFLMLFVVTVSAVSLVVWRVGLRWVKNFSAAADSVALPNSPPLAFNAFRTAIILGFVNSSVILIGTLVLYYKGV